MVLLLGVLPAVVSLQGSRNITGVVAVSTSERLGTHLSNHRHKIISFFQRGRALSFPCEDDKLFLDVHLKRGVLLHVPQQPWFVRSRVVTLCTLVLLSCETKMSGRLRQLQGKEH